MNERARAAIGSAVIEAVADHGCYNGEEIVTCEQAGMKRVMRILNVGRLMEAILA
jgi:hypothetical protein